MYVAGHIAAQPGYIGTRYAPRVGRLRLAMLYLVGLGLGDAADITVKGLEIVRRADKVFLEAYTSVLSVGKEALVSGARSCSLHVYRRVTRRWSEILLPPYQGGGLGLHHPHTIPFTIPHTCILAPSTFQSCTCTQSCVQCLHLCVQSWCNGDVISLYTRWM